MAIRILLTALLTICLSRAVALGGEPPTTRQVNASTQPSALEGFLRIHPKYMFKYYIDGYANGQSCALRGEGKLRDIKPGSLIYVEGRLGTSFHPGGSNTNPSPFVQTRYIYMEVESVKVVREPEPKDYKPKDYKGIFTSDGIITPRVR